MKEVKEGFFELLTTHCAGANYGAWKDQLDDLAFGTVLRAVREPSNEYDRNAIRLDAPDGSKVGYVPAVQAVWLCRMMDLGGYELLAEVVTVESYRSMVAISICMPKAPEDL